MPRLELDENVHVAVGAKVVAQNRALSNQQAATFLGLLHRNTMFVDNAGADIWILPGATEILQPGKLLSDSPLKEARGDPDVAWAEPLLYGGATISLPQGGSEQATLIGTRFPHWRGGPFNLVAGSADARAQPDAMIFEDLGACARSTAAASAPSASPGASSRWARSRTRSPSSISRAS